MRINVYSQELLLDNIDPRNGIPKITELVIQKADTGVMYSAVRLFLASSNRLHSSGEDDDRSAITFWLPKSKLRRARLAAQLEELAKLVINAPEETGLD